MAREEGLESFASLERRVAAELEAGLDSGDLRAYAEVFGQLLEHPAAQTMAGIGARAYRHVRRAPAPAGVRPDFPVGAGMPKSCYELAAAFALDHADVAEITLVHGYVHEPEDQPMPWCHAWCEVGADTLWDPSTGLYLVASDFYRVLDVVVAAVYTPAEAAANLAATGSAKQWPATLEAHARLIEEWGQGLERRCPELVDWVAEMLERDGCFSAEYGRLARANRINIVHVLMDLERRPERWRNHRPGEPWPWKLHPAVVMW